MWVGLCWRRVGLGNFTGDSGLPVALYILLGWPISSEKNHWVSCIGIINLAPSSQGERGAGCGMQHSVCWLSLHPCCEPGVLTCICAHGSRALGLSHWTAEPCLLLGWWGDTFSSVQSRARDLKSKHNTHFNQSSVSSPTHTSTCRNPCGVQSRARLWLWCTSVCFQASPAPLLVSGSSALLHHDQCHCFPDSEMVSLLLPAHFLSPSRFLALFSLLYCSLVYFQDRRE